MDMTDTMATEFFMGFLPVVKAYISKSRTAIFAEHNKLAFLIAYLQ